MQKSYNMCFSASASFASGAALSLAGAATIKKVKSKNHFFIAVIPFLFAIQQIGEGFVWLSYDWNNPSIGQSATYFYLFFAYLLWPVWIPFSVILIENIPWRKKVLYFFEAIGFMVSLYSLYFLLNGRVYHQLIFHHIVYGAPTGNIYFTGIFFYLLATCGSCFVSSKKFIVFLGALALISFTVAYYFYTVAFVSVWCFFAAIISFTIYLYFKYPQSL